MLACQRKRDRRARIAHRAVQHRAALDTRGQHVQAREACVIRHGESQGRVLERLDEGGTRARKRFGAAMLQDPKRSGRIQQVGAGPEPAVAHQAQDQHLHGGGLAKGREAPLQRHRQCCAREPDRKQRLFPGGNAGQRQALDCVAQRGVRLEALVQCVADAGEVMQWLGVRSWRLARCERCDIFGPRNGLGQQAQRSHGVVRIGQVGLAKVLRSVEAESAVGTLAGAHVTRCAPERGIDVGRRLRGRGHAVPASTSMPSICLRVWTRAARRRDTCALPFARAELARSTASSIDATASSRAALSCRRN